MTASAHLKYLEVGKKRYDVEKLVDHGMVIPLLAEKDFQANVRPYIAEDETWDIRITKEGEYIYIKYQDAKEGEPTEMRKLTLTDDAEIKIINTQNKLRTRSQLKNNPNSFRIILLEDGRRYNLDQGIENAKSIMTVTKSSLV